MCPIIHTEKRPRGSRVWNDERLQLTQKLEEAQNILEDKEKEYLENIELIEKNSNEKAIQFSSCRVRRVR